MPWFRCVIEGENFPGALVQRQGLVGFFATRWVEASSPEEAEIAALEALRSEPTFQTKTAKSAEARIYFTQIMEVDGSGGVDSGAVWFAMGS